ncbi:hypothetical protein DPMN_162217 [Dreissena polymorpha]|uniref:Uncharacterized protein n=1 Tax=Dreissena polymorpha TaxID=45954 RepID=A0A9D4IU41_DREPO|nr:hypothetical protein DPMN_162217 [Dreissena polymorpha]
MENNARRTEREFRPRLEIGGVRDIDFVNRYRVNRTTAQELVELLGQDLARSERGGKNNFARDQGFQSTEKML